MLKQLISNHRRSISAAAITKNIKKKKQKEKFKGGKKFEKKQAFLFCSILIDIGAPASSSRFARVMQKPQSILIISKVYFAASTFNVITNTALRITLASYHQHQENHRRHDKYLGRVSKKNIVNFFW